jgi:hypothetical protein
LDIRKSNDTLGLGTYFGLENLFVVALILLLQSCLAAPTVHAADRLNPDLLKTVVRIETPPNATGGYEIGSGFLFSTTGDTNGRILLITNKHMIGDWNPGDQNIQTFLPWINVFFYRTGDPSGESYRATKIDLLKTPKLLDTARVHLHPKEAIDLVAIEVTDKVNDKAVSSDYILDLVDSLK